MQSELRVPVQKRSVRTRADILAAAREEFAERGYALTTTRSIAERARVATGTFYHYFPDKDAVLRELTAARVGTLEQQLTGYTPLTEVEPAEMLAELRRRLRKDVKAYVEYHRRDRGLHAVISERRLCDRALDATMTAAEQRGVRRTAEALASWGFEGDCQATAFMIFSLIDGAVHNHVLGHPLVSDARFIDALVEAILRIGASQRMWSSLK